MIELAPDDKVILRTALLAVKNCTSSFDIVWLFWSEYQTRKTVHGTVDSGFRGLLYRGKSAFRGQLAADGNFYLIKAGEIKEKGAF